MFLICLYSKIAAIKIMLSEAAGDKNVKIYQRDGHCGTVSKATASPRNSDSGLGKVEEDGPNFGAPKPKWETWMNFLDFCSNLVQLQLLRPSGSKSADGSLSLSLSATLCCY